MACLQVWLACVLMVVGQQRALHVAIMAAQPRFVLGEGQKKIN